MPISLVGFIITFLVLFFCVQVIVAVDRRSHSVSDTFYGIFPFVVSALTILFWIGHNTSSE